MSVITTFQFTTPANYTAVNAEVASGFGRLALINNPSQTFNQGFSSSTGFTFDSNATEFVGGLLRQKDTSPSGSILAAIYFGDVNPITNQADLNWNKSGLLPATLRGAPTIVNGALRCVGVQETNYETITAPQETYKVKYIPNYTGGPASDIDIISVNNGVNQNDRVNFMHRTGNFRVELWNSTGSSVISTNTPPFSMTAGVEIELEIVIDSIAGTFRIFIDGVLHNTQSVTPWTRGASASILRLGANSTAKNLADASYNDLITFSDAQHSASYTPGYLVSPTIYTVDAVSLPDFDYSFLGTIQSLASLTTTEVNSPRYTFEGQYWNGSSWVVSNGSYAQAIDKATASTNLSSLAVSGQTAISVQVIWQASNSQSSVDDLTVTYEGQHYPLLGSLLTNSSFIAQTMGSFDSVVVTPTNTEIRYIFNVNGQDRWHDGSTFLNSNGTAAESNTLAEIQAVITTVLSGNSNVKIKVLLITTDDQITPDIDSMTVDYNFGALEPATPLQAQVFGFVKDVENNPIVGATVKVRPARDSSEYVEASSRVIGSELSRVTDSNGFFSFNLITSSQFESVDGDNFRYVLKVLFESGEVLENGGDEIFFTVPDVATINITDQIVAV